MNTTQKSLLAAVLIAIMAFLASLLPDLQSPSPLPSPTISPVASYLPSPSPSPSSVSQASSLKALKGETLGWIVRKPSGSELPPGVQAFEIRTVKTLVPSFKGASVGNYEDPLVPTTVIDSSKSYWVDYKPTLQNGVSTIKILGTDVTVQMLAKDYVQPVPYYMELTFDQVSRAHGLADSGTTLAARAALNAKYRAVYREHGIEPIKNAVNLTGHLNVDQFKEYGASFRQTTLDGAIAPPMILRWIPGQEYSDADLLAVEAGIQSGVFPKGSWSYVQDEHQYDIAQNVGTLARAQRYAKLAPSMRQLLTWRIDRPEFNAITQLTLCPVINWRTTEPCSYQSCMSNGNCAPQTDPAKVAPRTAFPAMVLEADPDEPRRFVVDAVKSGAKSLLYFNGTQKLTTAWQDGGLYSEGGNGDGTLIYPCPDKLNACPSLRMKMIRIGLQDAAKGIL